MFFREQKKFGKNFVFKDVREAEEFIRAKIRDMAAEEGYKSEEVALDFIYYGREVFLEKTERGARVSEKLAEVFRGERKKQN